MTGWKLKVFGVLTILVLVFFLHVKLFRFSETVYEGALETLICLGRVVKLDTSEAVDQILTFQIISGKFRGKTVQVNNFWAGREFADRVIRKGDVLFLEIPLRRPGQTTIEKAHMREYFRTPFLLYLGGLLGCLMILVAGMKGVRAGVAMIVVIVGVIFGLVPRLIEGYNPIAVTLLISGLLTLSTFLIITYDFKKMASALLESFRDLATRAFSPGIILTAIRVMPMKVIISGLSPKVISGVLATLGGLTAVGILSFISQKVMILTGLAQEFGFLELGVALWRTPASHGWDFEGILAAGIILGALGAMMDVGMSISSSVYEVKQVNPNVTVRQAIRAGLNVGRDIMGTMADTLIFAYLGAHMITMLLPRIDFPEVGLLYPFLRLVNDEAIAGAIIQAIVGTIGLVLTVPIAATIAGSLTKYTKVKPSDIHEDLPSAEEIEELYRRGPGGKARFTVPIALIVILAGIPFLHHRINRASATIVEERDESGNLASRSEYVKGKVIRLFESNPMSEIIEHQILEVEIRSGLYAGQRIVLRNILNHRMPLLTIPAEPGDIVLCRVGGAPDQMGLVNIVQEYGRDGYLLSMLGLMLILIVIVGRIEGVRTACAMIISGLILYFFMMPLVSGGADAVLIVTLTSGMIAFVSLVFVIGPGRKTFSAVLGTMGGILIAGLIVMFTQDYLHFSGLENAISADIAEATREPPFNFRQVLLAGMLMGVLGVAVDGAIEVSSSMEEIRRVNPNMPTWRLIASGMNVGTDILGTMVNTLVFAYIGVELLLFMAVVDPNLDLFRSPTVELLSLGIVSAEIVRLLAGTLGLVLTIPITAMISAFWNPKKGEKRGG